MVLPACKVFQSLLYKTNSFVYGDEDLLLVADPGIFPREILKIREFADGFGQKENQVIFFSHSDFDHVYGYSGFLDYEVLSSVKLGSGGKSRTCLEEMRKLDEKYYIERKEDLLFPDLNYTAEKEKTFCFGNSSCTLIPLPGHSSDSVALLLEDRKILVAGDYLSDIEIPFIEDSPEDYLSSLETLERLYREKKFEVLIPGHGTATGSAEKIQERIDNSRRYLEALLEKDEKGMETILADYEFSAGFRHEHSHNMSLLKEA